MDYMAIALALAKLAQGQVSPNPAVGAVVVKNDIILGQGYTQPPGLDHAEVVALKQAGSAASGATLYVTLEPCCHYGRTPPCTEAIVTAGIKEVHVTMIDPNPLVCGKGLESLRQAGIETHIGEHAEEAAEINEAFIKYITTGLPFVTVKFAASLDGKIATRNGDSKWITGDMARRYVQRMRYAADAVMTGANTIIADNPLLTVRIFDKGGTTHKQPLRIIVDGLGRTPPNSQIFTQPGKTLLVLGSILPSKQKELYFKAGAELLELPSDEGVIDLIDLLKILGKRHITSILVEAGGILLGSLFDNQLVDKVVAFLAPMIIGGEKARSAVAGNGYGKLTDGAQLKQVKVDRIGNDIMVSGYLVK